MVMGMVLITVTKMTKKYESGQKVKQAIVVDENENDVGLDEDELVSKLLLSQIFDMSLK